jgi:hypothetical protein
MSVMIGNMTSASETIALSANDHSNSNLETTKGVIRLGTKAIACGDMTCSGATASQVTAAEGLGTVFP